MIKDDLVLIEQLVGAQGQEFGELLAGHHFLEETAGEREFARRELAAEPLAVMLQDLPHHVCRHALPVGEARLIFDPLPDLRAGNLGGGGVLHQVIDRHAAVAAQPGGEILQAYVDIAVQALLA